MIEKENKIVELQGRIAFLEEEKNIALQTIQDKENMINSLNAQTVELQGQIGNLTAVINSKNEENKLLNEQTVALQGEKERLQADLDIANNSIVELNNSISETTDYDNTKALKIKINYTDNTNSIIQLKENQIDKISDTSYMYDFDIYVSKSITSIQIISNDETTIYQTITSTFEVGKLYNITQMVEIV